LNRDRQQRESPDAFDSGVSLRASFASLSPVLTSSAVVERVAPFIPTRFDWLDSLSGWE